MGAGEVTTRLLPDRAPRRRRPCTPRRSTRAVRLGIPTTPRRPARRCRRTRAATRSRRRPRARAARASRPRGLVVTVTLVAGAAWPVNRTISSDECFGVRGPLGRRPGSATRRAWPRAPAAACVASRLSARARSSAVVSSSRSGGGGGVAHPADVAAVAPSDRQPGSTEEHAAAADGRKAARHVPHPAIAGASGGASRVAIPAHPRCALFVIWLGSAGVSWRTGFAEGRTPASRCGPRSGHNSRRGAHRGGAVCGIAVAATGDRTARRRVRARRVTTSRTCRSTPAARPPRVTVVADGDDGLDLDAIAELSRIASALLDDLDTSAYVLEVTSPGVDRPLRTDKHFRRAQGRRVEVTLADGSTVTGRLGELRGGTVDLVVRDGTPRGADGARPGAATPSPKLLSRWSSRHRVRVSWSWRARPERRPEREHRHGRAARDRGRQGDHRRRRRRDHQIGAAHRVPAHRGARGRRPHRHRPQDRCRQGDRPPDRRRRQRAARMGRHP